jgi:hypothetical protein
MNRDKRVIQMNMRDTRVVVRRRQHLHHPPRRRHTVMRIPGRKRSRRPRQQPDLTSQSDTPGKRARAASHWTVAEGDIMEPVWRQMLTCDYERTRPDAARLDLDLYTRSLISWPMVLFGEPRPYGHLRRPGIVDIAEADHSDITRDWHHHLTDPAYVRSLTEQTSSDRTAAAGTLDHLDDALQAGNRDRVLDTMTAATEAILRAAALRQIAKGQPFSLDGWPSVTPAQAYMPTIRLDTADADLVRSRRWRAEDPAVPALVNHSRDRTGQAHNGPWPHLMTTRWCWRAAAGMSSGGAAMW